MTIPTILTWLRIALIPVLVGTMYMPEGVLTARVAQLVAAAIFVAAGITDWLDGYLARALKQQSQFGAFLDPVADKLLVCCTLILLVHIGRLHSSIAIVIVAREISVSALREWMAQVGQSTKVAVATIGKWKTTFQMIAIPFLLCNFKVTPHLTTAEIGAPLMVAAAVLTVMSMVQYLRAAAMTPPPSLPLKRRSTDVVGDRAGRSVA